MQSRITLSRTNSSNPDFINLNRELDAELAIRDGTDHSFYAQFNRVKHINHIVLAYCKGFAVGCGAIKRFDSEKMEIKRMFVLKQHRKNGIALLLLNELETWSAELGFKICILETGLKQPEAISLYKKCGYQLIPNYGQYFGVENSVCFVKEIII